MGEVFLAREELGSSARACVVKKVLPSLIENRQFVGRFLDESKVVVRLAHPNIARVYSMGEVGGEYYLAMEYIQGKTVSRFMHRLRQRKEVMPLGLILLIGERLCTGLAYAHDATDENGSPLQLVHRDLSPANVCVSYRGEVKIIDFGASTSTLKEEQTAPRVVIGNLTYMAPEQAKKKIVDRRADVYAAGVLLWELFAWKPLPQKGDPLERWRKAANPSWMPPSTHAPQLPPEIDEVIMKAIRKEPGERFASATALGEALSELRRRFAPEADEAGLAMLLTQAFEKEKAAEDAALAEINSKPADLSATELLPSIFIPPTALAFEHRSIAGPEGFSPEVPEAPERATDQGAPPLDRKITVPEVVSESRVAFQAATQAMDERLVREIEAPSGEDYHTSPYDTEGERRKRFLLFALGLFVGASALGFFVIWLLMAVR
ncbi:MAG TPA: serine/threonine-protein kinase [Myxococcaceae bacterium]|nr:serine/threonine-protein kinase [Myxococcaceae bacterium]